MAMLYPNPCYNKVCYNGMALYLTFNDNGFRGFVHELYLNLTTEPDLVDWMLSFLYI